MDLLGIYHRMPYGLRSMAASLKGGYLASWRYGPETERIVEVALSRDYWTAERWRQWQQERVSRLLNIAATTVPYYRDQWQRRRQKGDSSSWDYIENWPILEKNEIRQHARALLADGARPSRMFHEITSGTTGTPAHFWFPRESVREWYALFEARCRRWHDITIRRPWALLGGKLVVKRDAQRPPFWVWNSSLNQLYLSSYHVTSDSALHYAEAIKTHKVEHILGYPSALAALASAILQGGHKPVPQKVVLTNAEPLFPHQRRVIQEAFQCPVRDTYGLVEIVAAASECGAGKLHLWPDTGYVEVVQQPSDSAGSGDLVCTGLLNPAMPLIRYRIGDRGTLSASTACDCGRSLPQLVALEGRISDVIVSPDGRMLSPCNIELVFDDELPVVEGQIIQETAEHIRLCYVPAPGFLQRHADRMRDSLLRALGAGVSVTLQSMKEIPRGANQKLRAVVCLLSDEEKARLISTRTARRAGSV